MTYHRRGAQASDVTIDGARMRRCIVRVDGGLSEERVERKRTRRCARPPRVKIEGAIPEFFQSRLDSTNVVSSRSTGNERN